MSFNLTPWLKKLVDDNQKVVLSLKHLQLVSV